MQPNDLLEAKRIDFFKRAREDLEAGIDPIVWENELHELWPGPNGRFDKDAAFQAFQRENLHWSWGKPDRTDGSEQA